MTTMTTTPTATLDLTRDGQALLACFTTLQGLLGGLADVADRKLAAIRRADAGGLTACTQDELNLLQQVYRAEQDRTAIVARLAQALQAPELRGACISELTGRLPEPLASHLRARATGLKQVAAALKQKYAVAARVARGLQADIRGIFAELAKGRQESVVYGARGQQQGHGTPRLIVDAMG